MSSWYRGKWKCFICEFDTQVEFKRPQLLSPTSVAVKCRGCDSKFIVHYKREPGAKRHQFTSSAKLTFLSPVAIEVLKEQEAEKLKIQEILPA